MYPKKFKGKTYGAELTAAERRAMNIEINRQIAVKDEQYKENLDALILYVLMVKRGWKKKRLHDFWKDFIAVHKELRDFYQMDKAGDAEWFCHRELKKIGVDIRQWYKEENQDE